MRSRKSPLLIATTAGNGLSLVRRPAALCHQEQLFRLSSVASQEPRKDRERERERESYYVRTVHITLPPSLSVLSSLLSLLHFLCMALLSFSISEGSAKRVLFGASSVGPPFPAFACARVPAMIRSCPLRRPRETREAQK